MRHKLESYSHAEFFLERDRAPGHLDRCVGHAVHITGELSYRVVRRADLDPLLTPLLATNPEFFSFDPVGKWSQLCWRSWTRLRRRDAVPQRLVGFLDRAPWLITSVLGPVVIVGDRIDRYRSGAGT